MSIRSLLVPINGAAVSRSALETAFRIAGDFDAHVEGLFATPDDSELVPFVREGMNERMLRELLDNARGQVDRMKADARALFEEDCRKFGVSVAEDPGVVEGVSAGWRVETGNEADLVGSLGRVYDLVVAGRPVEGAEHPSLATVEAALFQTGRSVVVAPPEAPETVGRNVIIAWNRTAQSARAVDAALPFLSRAQRVVVLYVATGAKAGPSAQDLERHLGWHGVKSEVRELAPRRPGVGDMLFEQMADVGCDLLVMGGYSHTRWRQLVLGGVTHKMLHEATVPVLMTH